MLQQRGVGMFIKVEVDNFEQFEKDLQRVHE